MCDTWISYNCKWSSECQGHMAMLKPQLKFQGKNVKGWYLIINSYNNQLIISWCILAGSYMKNWITPINLKCEKTG